MITCAAAVRAVPAKLFEDVDADLVRIHAAAEGLRDQVRALADGLVPLTPRKSRHDLRTPLNHILGYGEMLYQEAEDNGRTDLLEDLGDILIAGRKVLRSLDPLIKALREHTDATPIVHLGTRVAGNVPSQVTGRVLVVDDNPANVDLLNRRLTRAGHTVSTAGDGEGALARLGASEVDLVLLDIVMPGIDGTEVLRRLKADPDMRDTPVIMVSGVDELPSVVQCIQLGADDYLTKPFDPVLLQARIRACIEKKQLRDRQREVVAEMEAEKRRADDLLSVIFPAPIVAELKQTSTVRPRRHDDVAVLFCDIVGFTAYSEQHEPEEVVANLQRLVARYEDVASDHGLMKIKTIGDAFMAVAGLEPGHENPVAQCVRWGLDMLAAMDGEHDWQVRIGVHIGPVVAGVLGRRRYQYDLWGDTVNTASRVEGSGTPGTITLSGDAWRTLAGVDGACAEPIGAVPMKGKGEVELYRFAGFGA